MDLQAFLSQSQQRVNQVMQQLLESSHDAGAESLLAAMRYSSLNGGKRIRPTLVYATASAMHIDPQEADACAAAVEFIHSYSLIHDDLPAMDDDDLRRGQPTCHKAFDEATAILAGDALHTLAFDLLSRPVTDSSFSKHLSDTQRLTMIQILASASGASGMVGGQAIDLASVGKQLSLEQLQAMHRHKTGALIRGSVLIGAHHQRTVTPKQLNALASYADAIGLAFQVQDDILDVETDTKTLGKQQGSDEEKGKPTYSSILGLEEAKKHAEHLRQQAHTALDDFGPEADVLRDIADYIVNRTF